MKDMERLREDFIATLTHDLRTPSLAAIQTLEYFLNGKLGELSEKQKMLLSTMKKSNEDMLGLVNTLLEVYKYESGRLRLVKTPFMFNLLLDECIEQVKPIADAKNQTIEKIYKNLDSSEILADRNEIRRVIINLLGNAVNYTPNGGIIEIKAEIEDKDLHFSVKDKFGDIWTDSPVVRDGNIITSQGAGTAVEFGLAIAEALCGKNTAFDVAKAICFNKFQPLC